jgi:hypothetical protein
MIAAPDPSEHGSVYADRTPTARWDASIQARARWAGYRPDPLVAFAVGHGSNYGHRTIKVHLYARRHVNPNGATGYGYALCTRN